MNKNDKQLQDSVNSADKREWMEKRWSFSWNIKKKGLKHVWQKIDVFLFLVVVHRYQVYYFLYIIVKVDNDDDKIDDDDDDEQMGEEHFLILTIKSIDSS